LRRKARERRGLFVAEGVRAVEELLASSLDVHGALIVTAPKPDARAAALRAALEARGVPVEAVSAAEHRLTGAPEHD